MDNGDEQELKMEQEILAEVSAPENESKPEEKSENNDEAGSVTQEVRTESGEECAETAENNVSMQELREEIAALRSLFEKKLFVDAYKDKMINNMSDELRTYKDGLYEKILKPVLVDVIEIVNDLHRMIRTYNSKKDETVDIKKFVSIMSIYESDLEDILEKYNVEIVTTEGDVFDAKKQKAVKVIETEDKSLHRVVAERLLKGFELNGKLLAPEKVNVYRYVEKETDTGTSGTGPECAAEENTVSDNN